MVKKITIIVAIFCFNNLSVFAQEQKDVISIQEELPENKIYSMVEQMPEFIGGDIALMTFIETNIVFPEEEKKEKIEGKVICSFIVNELGKVTNIKVLRGVPSHPNFDKEALIMMRKMPDWKPGKNNCKPVSVQYTLPIKFALPKK